MPPHPRRRPQHPPRQPRRKPRPRQKRPTPQTRIVIVRPQIDRAKARRPRKPPKRGTMRAVVAVIVVGILWLVMSATGVKLPSIASSPEPPAASGGLPSVSIEGSLPCQVNTSPIIQLTADRLHTCVEAKTYAKQKLTQKGQADQWSCQDQLWKHESDWSAWAHNPSSSAYGIPQAIESLYGHVYDAGDWQKQVDWGLDYIWQRYKTPCAAWAFWQAQKPNWY